MAIGVNHVRLLTAPRLFYYHRSQDLPWQARGIVADSVNSSQTAHSQDQLLFVDLLPRSIAGTSHLCVFFSQFILAVLTFTHHIYHHFTYPRLPNQYINEQIFAGSFLWWAPVVSLAWETLPVVTRLWFSSGESPLYSSQSRAGIHSACQWWACDLDWPISVFHFSASVTCTVMDILPKIVR